MFPYIQAEFQRISAVVMQGMLAAAPAAAGKLKFTNGLIVVVGLRFNFHSGSSSLSLVFGVE